MEYHLLKIVESSESIRTLFFRPPGIFSNALLKKPEITSLIRDADQAEQSLFTINVNGEAERVLPQGIHGIEGLHDSNTEEWNVDILCTAADRLANAYNIEGIQEIASDYRDNYRRLNQNILEKESLVENQRQQLSMLNDAIENRDLSVESADISTSAKVNTVIQQLRTDIVQLQQQLDYKEQEVRNNTPYLSSYTNIQLKRMESQKR